MLVNHNSIIGVNSITANGDQLSFYKEDGTDVIFNISNINVLNTSGVSTFAGLESTGDLVIGGNVSVGGTLTYEDVTNVDSVGIVTARIGVKVPAGEVTVGNNIQLGNAGVITATSFEGSFVGSSQIGIQSGGVQIGAGITQLNFIGAGNTFAVNGNTIDVSIQGGAGGSVDSDAQENTVAGSNAGNALDSDTERNTLFGFDTGKLIDSGDDNTLMGWKTGDAMTSGYKNTALGSEALPNCDSGNRNVAVGWEAGRSITSGNRNVALGNMAGRSWTDASKCIAIGEHSGSNYGSGSRNIAIGGDSNFLGGSDIIAIGDQAVSKSSTGTIGLGRYAAKNVTGDYNLHIGYESGYGDNSSPNSPGLHNIGLGYRSLYAKTSGFNNIAIGASTGNTITTGSNNILLGSNVQASSATASNEVVIGDSNISKFSVPGLDFLIASGGNVGIGTNLPSGKIHINNDANSILGRFDSNNKRCIDLVANDSTGDAEIRGFKNTGSGTHTQTILLDASGNSYLKGGNVALGHDNAVKLLHLRSDATSTGHTLLRLENLQNNTGGPTECHIDMWLDNSNSNNTGASIGIVEDSNDGYADLVFKTTPATNSDTLEERVRFDREGGVLIAGQPMHVCYAVTAASRTVTGSNSTTLLPSSSYDPMNDFNETTGVYTVPIAGRYLLFYGTQGKTSSSSNAGSIYYNLNNTGISGQCLYYGDAYSGNSKTTILNLSKNDTIKFQIHGNNGVGYTINGAHFGIYLLG